MLADAGYGVDGAFRAGVTALGLTYAVGVQPTLSVWPPGEEPLPPKPWSGKGRPPSRVRRDGDHRPALGQELSRMQLPAEAWSGRGRGAKAPTRPCPRASPRFVSGRRRATTSSPQPHPVEWLVIEWPEGEAEPTKYWLSTLPEDTPLEVLVDIIKLRWRIERDYEELKSELGLAQFEGRGWRGFHHHASLCIAAYGFLILERAALSPLSPLASRKTCRFRSYSILTRRRSVPNGTWPTRSRRCESD